MLVQLSRRLSHAIYLRVSDAELVARLGGRGRDDDNAKTIRNRLRTFHRYNTPLVTYYAVQGLLSEVDGEGDPEAVAVRLLALFA
jgi:adenylate kinase